MPSVRIIGPGRAGHAFAGALEAIGWRIAGLIGRGQTVVDAADGVDLLLITTPDSRIVDIAGQVEPNPDTVVAHVAGSRTLAPVARHPRHGSIHPLMAIPAGPEGVSRLRGHCWFAVAGDPMLAGVGEALGGRVIVVADDDRALYHAAATVASNHLVALMAQVERLAASVDIPLDAFIDLARGSLENVAELGPKAALTGPAARGDDETIRRHLEAIGLDERATYQALLEEARRLAGR
ncbi:MAG: DUF2520 domain-containing protein [Acidimicrobiia bacterium]|nr:DUF2520 domain-containing protein [Acidimicrobiia bacterium]